LGVHYTTSDFIRLHETSKSPAWLIPGMARSCF
jgi:hypothetical protein